MNDRLIDKLKKLLALAGNNPSQHEAELAMAKAQALAIENGIDLALIGNVDDNDDNEIVREDLELGQRLPTVNNFVTNILIEFFNVRIITSGNRTNGRRVIFVGKRDAIETARYVYSWLGDTMVRCWHNYYHNTPGTYLSFKQSYLLGFYNGLYNKLIQNRRSVEADKLTNDADKNKYAIACVNLKEQLQNFIDAEFNNLRKMPAKKITVHNDSYSRGHTDGSNCNIAKGALNSGKAVGAIC